jgi:hypothetical protein
MRTMSDVYGEPRDMAGGHLCCDDCHLCVTCGDCSCRRWLLPFLSSLFWVSLVGMLLIMVLLFVFDKFLVYAFLFSALCFFVCGLWIKELDEVEEKKKRKVIVYYKGDFWDRGKL